MSSMESEATVQAYAQYTPRAPVDIIGDAPVARYQAALRVLLDIPLLALKSCVGSTEMVITGPLARAFTKG